MRFPLDEDIIFLTKQLDLRDAEILCAAPILRFILLANIWVPNIELLHLPEGGVLDAQWLLGHTIEVGYLLHWC